ncbi:MAG: hypothetical protein ACTSP3_12765 [Candidatus Heimdallarchaeaceae archaeon]
MASVESFTKQNYEQFFIAGDLVDVLETGENIDLSNTTITSVDKDDNDVTTTILQAATKVLGDSPNGGTNNTVKIRVQAGVEAESPYKITFRIPTDLNNRYEIDLKCKIKEL